MVFARTATVSAVSLSFSICLVRAQSGLSPERLQVIQQTMTNVQQEAIGKLPPPVQLTLSGGALNFLHLATAWPKIQQSLGRGDNAAKLAELQAALQAQGSAKPVSSSGPISVSNPASDFVLSIMGGFTQSETSTAWCSSNVVVGFNGQGSFFESLLFGPGGISITGAGASTDGGRSFKDIGYINPGPNVFTTFIADPAVTCTGANAFYYSQIGVSGTGDAQAAAHRRRGSIGDRDAPL